MIELPGMLYQSGFSGTRRGNAYASDHPGEDFGLEGQVINRVEFKEETGGLRIICDRDRRRRPVDHRTGLRGLSIATCGGRSAMCR